MSDNSCTLQISSYLTIFFFLFEFYFTLTTLLLSHPLCVVLSVSIYLLIGPYLLVSRSPQIPLVPYPRRVCRIVSDSSTSPKEFTLTELYFTITSVAGTSSPSKDVTPPVTDSIQTSHRSVPLYRRHHCSLTNIDPQFIYLFI